MPGDLFSPPTAQGGPFVRVALERGLDHPAGLTYALPHSMRDARIGERVEAPLGRGDKPAHGYIVEVIAAPGLDAAKIKPILRRTGVALPATLVELARWMARYYCTPLGMVMASMAPAAVKRGIGSTTRTMLMPTGAEPRAPLTPSVLSAWDAARAIRETAWPIEPRALADAVGARTLAPINRLVALGLLRQVERQTVRAVWDDVPVPPDRALTLSSEQHAAIDAISPTLGSFRPHLLRGVTGSGKTEVYLRVIDRVLDRGESAIVLVPEISLTPQTVGRFQGRFGNRAGGVAVLHSGLTAAQRNQQWSAVASGVARVVVGARSAIFAPFPDGARVGLIVVDEEHEDGYKQDQLPRYHARDVAIKRAQIEACPIVLGSATPSMESWRNALEGRSTLSELTERVGGARLPRVEIVDLAEERRARPWTDQRIHLLGPRLEHAIARALAAGGQIILLLNRRGYANYLCCPDHRCGWVMTCDDCDAAMVYHRDKVSPRGGAVRCHHCLAERLLPELCPVCGKRVSVFGMGTQRVESELATLYPELIEGRTMLRLDGDTARTHQHWLDALSRFERGEVRLLLGTQMIAKGLDFPGVRLVGVVHADTAIHMPDFRAAERTFQLVSQVAGRAGRSVDPGLVIVQTLVPNAPAIRLAAAHDYRGFASAELATRERSRLPPYSRMARIVVRDADHSKAAAHAERIVEALRSAMEPLPQSPNEWIRLRGPMPAPISRVAGFHRIAIEVMASSPGAIQAVITSARNAGRLHSDSRTAVDIDPMALL